jgi:hypothetical protein
MNGACQIHFHADAAPLVADLPTRYQEHVSLNVGTGRLGGEPPVAMAIDVEHAFYIDVYPDILRTRIGGRGARPVDFHISSIAFIEWFDEKGK